MDKYLEIIVNILNETYIPYMIQLNFKFHFAKKQHAIFFCAKFMMRYEKHGTKNNG